MLAYFIGAVQGWLPSMYYTPIAQAGFWGALKCVILPSAALGFQSIASIARYTRSTMLDVLGDDYIRTARAKGVREFWVVVKHALKNAIMPVVTYLGPLVAGLLTGSFIVERMFSISGIGRYFVQSISDRDYTMIMGITIFFGVFVVVCNLVVDILAAIIDPRIKLSNQ